MKNSKFLKINGADIKKAIIIGAGVLAGGEAATPAIDEVVKIVNGTPQVGGGHANSIAFAVVTMLVYLLKNWFTNAKGDLLKKDIETGV